MAAEAARAAGNACQGGSASRQGLTPTTLLQRTGRQRPDAAGAMVKEQFRESDVAKKM